MSQNTQSHYDMKRKQDVVSDVFGNKLAHEDLKEALRICTEEFGDHRELTASDFCQRLVETRPEIAIGKQTRLLFLRGVRQQDMKSAPESERETLKSTALIPAVWHKPSGSLHPSIPERRQNLRKTTDLMGVYWHALDREQMGAMIVENLSLGGCGIRILTPHELKRGEILRLDFRLDDASETFISIRGKLRWVLYDLAGIEFYSSYAMPGVLADYIRS